MKYNQPYGISDPNAPYINGDPSVGRAGSIPPAASIEFPQREIVNVVTDAGLLLPDNADLHQLAKAIQSGQLNYKPDTGLANFYAATLNPNPGSYYDGLTAVLKIKNTNTGPAVLNLNGIGNAPIVRNDGSDVAAGDLLAGSMACFVFDDDRAQFQVVWSSAVAVGPPGPPGPPGDPGGTDGGGGQIWLSAPLLLYVNGTTGNDSWDGRSAAFSTGTHGPFKTLQRAANECRKYNLNNYQITIQVAPGTYARAILYDGNGSGSIAWMGDTVNTPPTVVISDVGYCVQAGKNNSFNGFRFASSGPDVDGWPGWGIYGAGFFVFKVWFDFCAAGHMAAAEGFAGIIGPIYINGGGWYHIAADGGRVGLNSAPWPDLNIVGAANFSVGFYDVLNIGRIVGKYTTITGAGLVTGKKFSAEGNSLINSIGMGVGYLPGNAAGTLTSGAEYI